MKLTTEYLENLYVKDQQDHGVSDVEARRIFQQWLRYASNPTAWSTRPPRYKRR